MSRETTLSPPAPLAPPPARLVSLDAYRGFVMLCLAANGFGIAATAKNFPDSPWWTWWGSQFEHVYWTGGVFWDLIQPSFMFMVGVALPYSMLKRVESGDSPPRLWVRVLLRALILVLLGVALSSNKDVRTNFTFVNVLTQIGLGYPFLYLMWRRPWQQQAGVAAVVLVAYWLLFTTFPAVPPEADLTPVGVTAAEPRLQGFYAHWQKNANVAHDFDTWFLNLFPRAEPFRFNRGGYQTLNFVPSFVTMLIGLMTGEYLQRRAGTTALVWTRLLLAGLALIFVGWLLHVSGVCPLVKRIWTPAWTLYSTGWTVLMLAGFYSVVEVLRWRTWTFPLVVAGTNSIALYVMSQLLPPWTSEFLKKHLGRDVFLGFGTAYAPMVEACSILVAFWLVTWWLYRQRIFFRL